MWWKKVYLCMEKAGLLPGLVDIIMCFTMQDILMTPDVCMRFLVWSYYYHGVMPERSVSYRVCGKFADKDAVRLDELRDLLFKCFEEQSVLNACRQFEMAKVRREPCPFAQDELDAMFASERA